MMNATWCGALNKLIIVIRESAMQACTTCLSMSAAGCQLQQLDAHARRLLENVLTQMHCCNMLYSMTDTETYLIEQSTQAIVTSGVPHVKHAPCGMYVLYERHQSGHKRMEMKQKSSLPVLHVEAVAYGPQRLVRLCIACAAGSAVTATDAAFTHATPGWCAVATAAASAAAAAATSNSSGSSSTTINGAVVTQTVTSQTAVGGPPCLLPTSTAGALRMCGNSCGGTLLHTAQLVPACTARRCIQ